MTEDKMERFNFMSDDGQLSSLEVWRCFRKSCLEIWDESDYHKDVEVEMRNPQDKGYSNLQKIGEGGQGGVYLAKHSGFGKVVLKIYTKGDPNAGGIEELIDEFEALKMMEDCPWVMTTIDIFQDQDYLYSVNELLPGGDLASIRQNAKKSWVDMNEKWWLKIFQQVLTGIMKMHHKCIMHCDIKEPNIMVKNKSFREPVVCLIDLGLAQASASPGVAGGTPGYRPPETNRNNKWYPKGDIFACGVTFFQLLADRVPNEDTGALGVFQEGAEDLNDVARFVATRNLPIDEIEGSYPGFAKILSSMCEKERNKRYQAKTYLQDKIFEGVPLIGADYRAGRGWWPC